MRDVDFAGDAQRAARSAVGVFAVADADGLVIQLETDAPVADAQAELGWVDALEFFHVPGAGFGEALDGPLHAAGDAFVERSQVLQGGLSPFDLSHSSAVILIPTGAWPLDGEYPCLRCA